MNFDKEKVKNVNKEKLYEIEIAKAFGQKLVDKIKKLPDETDQDIDRAEN